MLKIGDKVKVIEHKNSAYTDKIGILLSARIIQPAIQGQKIKEKICKVKLDDTGEIIDCLLGNLVKI